MIITSFCEQFLEKYISEEIKNGKNSLKIDKRIIIGLHNGSKNVTFKTASKLTEKFNNYLGTLENIDTFFIMEDLISSEKDRKIIIFYKKNELFLSPKAKVLIYLLQVENWFSLYFELLQK